MTSNDKYVNAKKGFTSYFLSFGKNARIELMHRSDITDLHKVKGEVNGLAHFAISVGSKEIVDKLTELLGTDGFVIQGEPRTTGDGYYESIILDPEGNWVEITI